MNKSMIKAIKVAAVTMSLAGVIVAMGFGCGMGWQPIGFESGYGSFTGPSDSGNNNNLVIISGTRTVAVTNFNSVLDAMTSMTNVPPSNNTRNIFNQNVGSFSENGSALSINAPMLFSYMSVGAEVCNDLINAESNLPAAQRRFFGPLNLATNNRDASAVNDELIADMTRRFARQFWQRNETEDELAMITAGIRQVFQARPANTQGLSRQVALATCTAMISSTSAYEI